MRRRISFGRVVSGRGERCCCADGGDGSMGKCGGLFDGLAVGRHISDVRTLSCTGHNRTACQASTPIGGPTDNVLPRYEPISRINIYIA